MAFLCATATQVPAWIELQSLHDGLHLGRLQPWVSHTHVGLLVPAPAGLDGVMAALAHGQLHVDAHNSFLSVTSDEFVRTCVRWFVCYGVAFIIVGTLQSGSVCFVMLFSNTTIGGESFLCTTAQPGSSICRSQDHILPLQQLHAFGGVAVNFPAKALALADLDMSRSLVSAVPTRDACWANTFG